MSEREKLHDSWIQLQVAEHANNSVHAHLEPTLYVFHAYVESLELQQNNNRANLQSPRTVSPFFGILGYFVEATVWCNAGAHVA